MYKDIKKIIKNYNITPDKYTIKKNVIIIYENNNKYVLKKNNINTVKIYNYLLSRNFNSFPKIINNDYNLGYTVYEYIENIDYPKEQKAIDIINVMSQLHNKTTYYTDVIKDEYEKTILKLKERLNYIYNYYTDLINIAEKSIYMSPKEYMLSRNISKIFSAILYCNNLIKKIEEILEDKKKKRIVLLHGNLELEHLRKNTKPFLISWDKAHEGIPIYDFYNFFEKEYSKLDFNILFIEYIKKYPLLKEEAYMLFIMISIPIKIEYYQKEKKVCEQICMLREKLFKAEEIIKSYESIKNN